MAPGGTSLPLPLSATSLYITIMTLSLSCFTLRSSHHLSTHSRPPLHLLDAGPTCTQCLKLQSSLSNSGRIARIYCPMYYIFGKLLSWPSKCQAESFWWNHQSLTHLIPLHNPHSHTLGWKEASHMAARGKQLQQLQPVRAWPEKCGVVLFSARCIKAAWLFFFLNSPKRETRSCLRALYASSFFLSVSLLHLRTVYIQTMS